MLKHSQRACGTQCGLGEQIRQVALKAIARERRGRAALANEQQENVDLSFQ